MKAHRNGNTIEISLPSTFEALEWLVEKSDQFFSDHYSDDDLVYRLVLLTSEAATNGIEHGNKFDPLLRARITLTAGRDEATIEVIDQGKGFSRGDVADPLSEERRSAERGRGVFLMESMADEAVWDDDGRRVRLTVRIEGEGGVQEKGV